MQTRSWTRRIARSPLAPIVAFPVRARAVATYDGRVLSRSVRWLFTSREHHNYTYDITARNREHLAWFITAVTDAPAPVVRGWLDEVEHDELLREVLTAGLASSNRRGLADRTVRYGRRIGWYALIRAIKPEHVVETGVDKGLGSCIIAAAMLRNHEEGHSGRLSALDINPDAGYLIAPPYDEVVDLVLGDSLRTIPALSRPVDLFIHDSWHSVDHETAEFGLIEKQLADDAILLTDNAAETDVLVRHAERTGRRFLYFDETPDGHWFPGDGTGIAWKDRGR